MEAMVELEITRDALINLRSPLLRPEGKEVQE
jgi:hypothetical protein